MGLVNQVQQVTAGTHRARGAGLVDVGAGLVQRFHLRDGHLQTTCPRVATTDATRHSSQGIFSGRFPSPPALPQGGMSS